MAMMPRHKDAKKGLSPKEISVNLLPEVKSAHFDPNSSTLRENDTSKMAQLLVIEPPIAKVNARQSQETIKTGHETQVAL